MMKKQILTSCLSLFILFVFGAALVSAQSTENPPGQSTENTLKITIDNPFNCGGVEPCTLETLLMAIINNILMPIGGVIAVLAFIYSGFLFVYAQDNSNKRKDAREAFLATVIGTAILLGAWTIANVIGGTIEQLRTPN